MGVTLDGQAVFDEQGLTITVGSPTRACVERSICGLDGTVSIDLGARGRRLQQTGVLRAAGRAAMNARISPLPRSSTAGRTPSPPPMGTCTAACAWIASCRLASTRAGRGVSSNTRSRTRNWRTDGDVISSPGYRSRSGVHFAGRHRGGWRMRGCISRGASDLAFVSRRDVSSGLREWPVRRSDH